jgi:predicted lipid-binding transport protein (Tim44 family)
VYASAAARIGIVQRVRWLRPLAALFFLAFGLLLWAEEADARLARDARFADGARAIGLNQAALAAYQEEISPCAVHPPYPAGSLGGLFSRPGMIGGFAAGFLGAGIFGLLFGHGVIGELSGVPSILGLIFQFALLLALGWAIRVWWRADKAAAVAQLSPRQLADAYGRARNEALPEFATDANAGSKVDGENSFADEAHLPL